MTTQISGDTGVSAVQDDAVNPATDIAYNQTWQDVTASRALATDYTNNTGQPIEIHVRATSTAATPVTVTVNGVDILAAVQPAGTQSVNHLTIPAGAVYRATMTSGTLSGWQELR